MSFRSCLTCLVWSGLAFFMAIFVLPLTSLWAEEGPAVVKPADGRDKAASLDHPADQQRWVVFPIIASSPETGLMLGGMLFHFLPVEATGEQASTIDLMVYGTTKGQYALSLSPNIFLASGTYRINASLDGSFWKANYYEPGNDSPDLSEKYELTSLTANLTLERRLFDFLVFDLLGYYDRSEIETEPGGMLATGQVFGATDGTYVGLGVDGGYDTRDNTNSPTTGVVARYCYVKYAEGLGSDLDFSLQKAELRYYRKIDWRKDSVLALAADFRSTDGEVPFGYLSSPDGTMILRGIENGRYKDRDMISLQSEYRFPIYKKISGTVFAEASQVAPGFGDMEIKEFKTSLGSGFRYALNQDQRFNIRADLAWVDDGIGVIVNIREAF
ncbi:MAG: BamA/TamA family outer membrane protein [Proteobacteria bacterium]|nr:BamA/TamA family outer membrane protein [Pseudomonadota bacterium]MBU1715676.1 BamA/TamA family outer membrane protein [Pseudomonadota bacterium]